MDYYLRLPTSEFKIKQFVSLCNSDPGENKGIIEVIITHQYRIPGVYSRSGLFCWFYDTPPSDLEEFTLELLIPKVNIF